MNNRAAASLLAGLLLGCGAEPEEGASSESNSAEAATSETSAPLPADAQRATLTIEGMVCESCAGAVQQALESTPGVLSAETSFASGTAVAVFDPDGTSPEALARALEAVERGTAPPFRVVDYTLDAGD
ncbi:MAG: heavy-metal-associated domain-containing protein [Deltaproteobacteria bacterium]|nr:heavy-metal-associated domain-containing protein [Deltaproteobacteria bacterium]